MAWLAAATEAAQAAPAANIAKAGMASGEGGFFSKAGNYLNTDAGRNDIANMSEQGKKATEQASATAAASSQAASGQGMQFANMGGQASVQPSTPIGLLQSGGYDPMSMFQRLQMFRGR